MLRAMWPVDDRVVDSVTTEESGISTITSRRVAAGTPGVVET